MDARLNVKDMAKAIGSIVKTKRTRIKTKQSSKASPEFVNIQLRHRVCINTTISC